jgi:diguanylate cyclase (GGDEF)-like protein
MYAYAARHPAVLAAITAVQLGAGKVGLEFLSNGPGAPAVGLPSGIALAALVLFGPRAWPAIAAGAFLTHFTETGEFLAAVASGGAQAIEALIGAALVSRFAGGADVFRSSAQIFRFVAIAMGAPAVSAVILGASRTFSAEVGWMGFANLWMSAWLGHVVGILTATPLALLWVHGGRKVRWLELAEGAVLMIVLALLSLVIFAGQFPSDIKTYPLEFLCLPLFLWAAFRIGRRGVATAMAIMAAIAAWGTLHEFGPFVRDTMNESLVLFQAYVAVMSVMCMVLATVVADHKRAEQQLHELAITDSLTGLANYRRLLDVMRGEITRSRRTGRPFAVIFVDMDGLKAINDRYGHLTGSRALCRVADVLRQTCRSIDTSARFGGDEFAIVLPETTAEGGASVLARVCANVEADSDSPAISVSGGLAIFPRDGDSPTLLLRAADQALYEAKTRKPARIARLREAEDPTIV